MQSMPIKEAVQRCLNVCMGVEASFAYAAACAVVRSVYETGFDKMSGRVRSVKEYMSDEDWQRWSTQSIRENCAWALEKYAEKYGALTPP